MLRRLLREGALDSQEIEFEVSNSRQNPFEAGFPQEGFQGQWFLKIDRPGGARQDKRKMKISEARPLLEEQECDRMIPPEIIQRDAIKAVEQDGIVFIDEIDKIVVNSSQHYGADASSEGEKMCTLM